MHTRFYVCVLVVACTLTAFAIFSTNVPIALRLLFGYVGWIALLAYLWQGFLCGDFDKARERAWKQGLEKASKWASKRI